MQRSPGMSRGLNPSSPCVFSEWLSQAFPSCSEASGVGEDTTEPLGWECPLIRATSLPSVESPRPGRCQVPVPQPPRALKRQKSMTSSFLQLQLSVSEIHANRISLERIPRGCGGLCSQIGWLNLSNKYFLSSYEVPGTVLDIWDSGTNIISSFSYCSN